MTDCEERDTWFLAQDVNAWTSVAYIAVGAAVVAVVLRRHLPHHYLALGGISTLAGIGSLGYHAGSSGAAHLAHDVALLAVLGFVAGWHVGRCVDRPATTWALAGGGGGMVGGAGLWLVAPGTTSIVTAVLVAVVVGAEMVARRRGSAPIWNTPLLVLVAIAAVTWAAGTPGSRFCAPSSWLQPHGAWHALTALAILAWFARAVDAREAP